MITIEDKIKSFKNIICDDIKEKMEEEINNIKKENEDKITKHKAKVYEDIKRLKIDYKSRLESKTDAIHSKILKEGQNIILGVNRQIYDDFFKDLREKIKTDYMTSLGEKYIKNKIESIKNELKDDYVFYLFEPAFDRDESILKNIIPSANIRKSDNIKLGGFEIENSEKTYRINFSLDFLLENSRTYILGKLKQVCTQD